MLINNLMLLSFLNGKKHIKRKINDTSQKRRTTRKTIIPFENEGVLNPAAIKEGDFVHLLSSSAKAIIQA
jgi:hypothetical protein